MTERTVQPGLDSPPPPPPAPLWQRLVIGRKPKRTLLRAVALFVTAIVVFKFILLPVRIDGTSMEPAYHDHAINFINRLAYLGRPPRRGDVVGVRLSPPHGLSGPHVMYFKRLIGLPGETVAIRRGVVFINGQPLEEPYVRAREAWEESPRTLKAGEYFIIGDNRGMPKYLHEHGIVDADRIVGKVLW